MTKILLRCVLVAACVAVEPSFAQGVPAGAFVVAAPVFGGVITPNSGVRGSGFTVTAKPVGNQSSSQPFLVYSSDGALALSSQQDCSKPTSQIGAITPVTLFACLDTQKVVRGTYVFLLTVRAPRPFRPGGAAGSATERQDATPNCDAQTGPIPETRVAVTVTVAGAGAIKTTPSSLTLNSDTLSRTFLISYVSGSASSGSVKSVTPASTVTDEGAWLTINADDCAGLSLDNTNVSCAVTITANPFKLIGATLNQRFTNSIKVIGSDGTSQDVVINFDYTKTVASQLFPHLADGDEWQTDFVLINTTACLASVDLLFHSDATGTLLFAPTLPITSVGGVPGIRSISIPAGGSVQFRTLGARLTPLVTGWVEIVAPVRIDGQAIFRRHAIDGKTYEGSVPVTFPVSNFSVAYDGTTFEGATRFTAIALVNPDSANTAKVTCSDSITGKTLFSTNNVPPNIHAQGLFTLDSTARGTAICNSTTPDGLRAQPVGALGLVALGLSAFSSLPII